MLIEDVARMLVDAGVGTLHTTANQAGDIWLGDMGDTPDNAIMITPQPSGAPDSYLDTEYLNVDFWVRDKDSETAYNRLRGVFSLFHRRANYQTQAGSEWWVYFSHALGQIEDMDRDSQNRKLYRLTVRFMYHSLSSIS